MGGESPVARTRRAVTAAVAGVCLLAFAAVALGAPGDLDPTFSSDGKLITPVSPGGGSDAIEEIVIQPDGKIAVAGDSTSPATASDFTLARYNPNGTLDTSFSNDGVQVTPFMPGVSADHANGLRLQNDGKLVAAGWSDQGVATGPDFAIARYKPDGSPDGSFSADGRNTTAVGAGAASDFAAALAIQADGKMVVAGRSDQGLTGSDFALVRYLPNGTPDGSFSGDGKQTTALAPLTGLDSAKAVAIQADGKVVAFGNSEQVGSGTDFALARYTANGELDSSFAGDGKQTTPIGPLLAEDSGQAMAIQPDGKIVVAGFTDQNLPQHGEVAVARYTPNGELDPSFSGDGKQTISLAAGVLGLALAIQPDGKLVIAGGAVVTLGVDSDFAVVRLNSDGSLDASFSGDGRQTTSFGTAGEAARAVAIEADGDIVAGGEAEGSATGIDFALARYLGDRADLFVSKVDTPDPVRRRRALAYTLTVRNAGPQAAGGAMLLDRLPAGVSFASASASQGSCSSAVGVVSCVLGTLPPGGAAAVTVRVTVARNARGPISNVASATGPTGDPNPGNNVAAASTLLRGRCLNDKRGTRRANRLVGTRQGDRILGLSGNDRISGGRGDDCLSGGRGRDRIAGGGGKDRLSGGSGNDRLSGGSRGDRLTGGRGRDRFSGGSGNDRITSADGRRETVRCGRGRDRVRADRDDRLIGCERIHRR